MHCHDDLHFAVQLWDQLVRFAIHDMWTVALMISWPY